MTRRGPYSSDYSDEARRRFGTAVEDTRRALGFDTRRQFRRATGIGSRSIEKVERGEPGVGPNVFGRLHRALPGWSMDTIREILEGGPIPPMPRPGVRVDVQFHARDDIAALLASAADPATVLREMMRWHDRFKDAGLTGDDLLTVSREALARR